ncbi:hypothetical protein SBADM41S_08787 [Streptomyces badius]
MWGSLSARTWAATGRAASARQSAVSGYWCCAFRSLGVLRLGDDDARALGVRVGGAAGGRAGAPSSSRPGRSRSCGVAAWAGFRARGTRPPSARSRRRRGRAGRRPLCGAIAPARSSMQPTSLVWLALAPAGRSPRRGPALVRLRPGARWLERGRRPARTGLNPAARCFADRPRRAPGRRRRPAARAPGRGRRPGIVPAERPGWTAGRGSSHDGALARLFTRVTPVGLARSYRGMKIIFINVCAAARTNAATHTHPM